MAAGGRDAFGRDPADRLLPMPPDEIERDPDRQLRDRAQFGQRSLRDEFAAIHDQDMLGTILELVERVRGNQHGRAIVAEFVKIS